MGDMANKIVSYLSENITDSSGANANALVRFYKTHPYDQLDQGLQGFAQGILGSAPSDDTNCLTMLAAMGDNDDWKSRSKSNGHHAIPLASADMVAGIPIIPVADPVWPRCRFGHAARPHPDRRHVVQDLQHFLRARGSG